MINKAKLLILVLLVSAATSYAASESYAKGFSISAWAWHIANFAVFAYIINWIYRSKIKGVLVAQRRAIEEHAKRAGAVLSSANADLQQVRENIASFKEEAQEIAEAYKEEGKRLAVSLLEDAKRDSISIASDAERRLESEKKIAERAIREKVLSTAVEQAEKQIAGASSPELDVALRAEAIKSFQNG